MTLAAGLGVLLMLALRFRPPLPSAALYDTVRRYVRPGAEALLDDIARVAVDPSPAEVLDDPHHLRMTTHEFAVYVEAEAARDRRALDRVEDELRAGLEWLEATVAVWVDADPEFAHAAGVMRADWGWGVAKV